MELDRGRFSWEDSINIGLKEIGRMEEMGWICLTQDTENWSAAAKTVSNFSVV
jgi:hypothetical protein